MSYTKTTLHRRLTLPLLVLYGVGVTIGAGIYVLIGAMAGRAGMLTPLAFLMAGLVMGFTAASFVELCTRLPYSAGEASYVKAAFHSKTFSIIVGLITVLIGIVSSAAVSRGSIGYIQELVELPQSILLILVITLLGAVAIFGILESVLLAAVFTLIEVAGLILIIVAGMQSDINLSAAAPAMLIPAFEPLALSGLAFAILLAFFAFIGFEDLVNVVEEVKQPERTLPRAIVLTLLISIVLYFLVAAYSVLAVTPERLASSAAPLALVFRELAGVDPTIVSMIAIVATLNTILVQMTMASRVLYGMANHGSLPRAFGHIHPSTRTPLLSTLVIVFLVLLLSLVAPLELLAEWTSIATLCVFASVNAALIKIKFDRVPPSGKVIIVPFWIPATGLLTCIVMLMTAVF